MRSKAYPPLPFQFTIKLDTPGCELLNKAASLAKMRPTRFVTSVLMNMAHLIVQSAKTDDRATFDRLIESLGLNEEKGGDANA